MRKLWNLDGIREDKPGECVMVVCSSCRTSEPIWIVFCGGGNNGKGEDNLKAGLEKSRVLAC